MPPPLLQKTENETRSAMDEILIVEDDSTIRRMLRVALRAEGYRTYEAACGVTALSLNDANAPALILLDLGLPDLDGMEVLAQIRKEGDTPIIVLTARTQDAQKVAALDAGADDYVSKPFSMAELLARIRVALRHHASKTAENAGIYSVSSLTVNLDARTVTLDGATVHLTPHEFDLLKTMMENPGKALTHRFLQNAVWKYPSTDSYRTLRVTMASLRRKLSDTPASPRFIATDVGIGYRFVGE